MQSKRGLWPAWHTMPAAVIRYRGLIAAIVAKEIAGRYAGSLLGPFWLIIPPIFMVFIYTVVFSGVLGSRLGSNTSPYAYSLFLCGGLLVWMPFLDAVQRSKGVFLEHATLIKKSAFPRLVLFIPVLVVALLNFVLFALVFLVFLAIAGHLPVAIGNLIWVPVCAFVAALLGLAIGLALAVLNVFFRDIAQITDLVTQLLFWATPIIYPATILPTSAGHVLKLNPLVPLVDTSQQAILGTLATSAGWEALAPAGIVLAVLFLLSWLLYVRAYSDLMDRI